MNRFIVPLLIVVVLAICTPASAQDVDTSFRMLVSESELETHIETVLKGVGGIDTLSKSKMPAIGAQVRQVLPGGTAAQLGLRAGDVLTRVDNKVLWGGSHNLSAENRLPLQFYDADTKELVTRFVQSDRLQVVLEPVWNPEQTFLNSEQRSPDFDKYLVAAAISRGTAPEFAESALHQAVKKSYIPGTITDQIGLEIALMTNRFDVAKQFGQRLKPKLGEDDSINPLLLIKLGLATGDLKLVSDVMSFQDRYELESDTSPEAMKWLGGILDLTLETDDESYAHDKLAEQAFRDDITHRMRPARYLNYPELHDVVRRESSFKLRAPTAHLHYVNLKSPTPMPNFEVETSFHFAASDEQVNTFLKLVQIEAITEPYAARFDKIASIAISPHGCVTLEFGNAPTNLEFFDPSISQGVSNQANIKLRRIANVIEVFLNDHRILLAPAHAGFDDVTFRLKAVGMEAKFDSWSVVELIPQIR